jgi:uncharacterized protein (DUF1800 family)
MGCLGRKKFAALLLLFSVVCFTPQLLAKKEGQPNSDADAQRRAVHALNRLTFGPRPGDVQQVIAMGVDRWIDLQLHPQRIDDSALNSRLEPFRTLHMSSEQIAKNFPDNQEINQIANGKRPMPNDPVLRVVYEVQIARLEAQREKKEAETKSVATQEKMMTLDAENSATAAGAAESQDASSMNRKGDEAANGTNSPDADANANAASPAKLTAEEKMQARVRRQEVRVELGVEQLENLPADERYNRVLAMPANDILALVDALRGSNAQEFLQGMTSAQKETMLALANAPAVVDSELEQAKLFRAIYSQRQLEEVMTDFWFNHFNVFVGKGLDRVMLTSYERDVIRPHALGKFEDLLVATAKSPAMLFYLDNWMSVGPNSPQALGMPLHPNPNFRPKAGKRPSGLNENYGRELLELHTLSVNGGYTQHDVTEVAKVFTGWTIDKPAQGGEFKFEPRMHEPGSKFVLGHRIKENGEDEGLELLHRLATSPKTAHFISLKLAERFVSDDPPPELVSQMAKTFLRKKGDIREVLSVLFHSPEFWNDSTYRAKVKTPLEFVASSIRATGAEVDDAKPLIQQLNRMGMPLYGAQPPTGYSMKAETWVSSSALLNRMNFALALTNGNVRGVELNAAQLAASDGAADLPSILSTMESSLIAGGVSRQTHDSILAQVDSTKDHAPAKQENNFVAFKPKDTNLGPEINTMAGLLLGSPEFQRR